LYGFGASHIRPGLSDTCPFRHSPAGQQLEDANGHRALDSVIGSEHPLSKFKHKSNII